MLLGMLAPGTALSWETGKELSEVIFEGVDTSGNGLLDYGEISEMGESIALSADANSDGELSLDEFMAWDFGYAYLADVEDGTDTFTAVKRVMSAVSDIDADGTIDVRDWRLSNRWSFERADRDGDGLLTENEFLTGWTPIAMLKAGRGS